MQADIEGKAYVERMRKEGLKDSAIRKKLEKARWYDHEIAAAFGIEDPETPPAAPHERSNPQPSSTPAAQPEAVVERNTTLGLEYGVMFLALAIGAIALGSVAHAYIDVIFGKQAYFNNPLANAAAIIALPVFAFMFLRLRRTEHAHPEVKADNSRRKWVQATLLISFIIGIGHTIWYVYNLMNGYSEPAYEYGYSESRSLDQPSYQLLQLGHLLVTLLIAGSIFTYYWIDEHKHKQ